MSLSQQTGVHCDIQGSDLTVFDTYLNEPSTILLLRRWYHVRGWLMSIALQNRQTCFNFESLRTPSRVRGCTMRISAGISWMGPRAPLNWGKREWRFTVQHQSADLRRPPSGVHQCFCHCERLWLHKGRFFDQRRNGLQKAIRV